MNRWPKIQLRHVTRCLDGQRVPLNSAERAEIPGDVPYWGANGVIDHVNRHLFEEELVLLGEDGAPFFELGKDVAFRISGPAWINNHIHVLLPINIHPGYLVYALNIVDYVPVISGSTRDKLTQDDMNRIELPYPALEEQQAIVRFLDVETARIDALITKKRRMIELFMIYARSLIDDTVEERGSKVILRRFATRITSGPRGWSDRVASSGSLFLRITNVQRHDIELDMSDKLFVDAPDSAEARRVRVRKGDVLVSITADIGSVGIARDDHEGAYVSQHIALVTANGCEPEWLAYSLRGTTAQAWLDGSRYGGTKAQLALEDVAQTPIWLPSREEQLYRLDILRDKLARSKRIIDAIRSQIELLREHRQALIAAAVTGELEVSGQSSVDA